LSAEARRAVLVFRAPTRSCPSRDDAKEDKHRFARGVVFLLELGPQIEQIVGGPGVRQGANRAVSNAMQLIVPVVAEVLNLPGSIEENVEKSLLLRTQHVTSGLYGLKQFV
jgi:hypothetical protein